MKKLIILLLILTSFMGRAQQQILNLGAGPNDHTGDNLRTGGNKINANFTQLFGGVANTILGTNSAGTAPEFKTVSNGLTAAAGTFKLGGTLNVATTITGQQPFKFGVSNVAPALDFQMYVTSGSINSDNFYVNNTTTNGGWGINANGPYVHVNSSQDAQGDLHYLNAATNYARLGIGSANKYLTTDGSLPNWSTFTLNLGGNLTTAAAFNVPANASGVLTNNGSGVLTWGAGGGGGTWGSITGTLSNQTDLQTALDGKWSFANGGTLTGPNVITGTTTNTLKYVFDNLGTTITNGTGHWLANNQAALVGAQVQISPSTFYEGQCYESTGGTSQSVKWAVNNLPQPGATATAFLRFTSSINNGAWTSSVQFLPGGSIYCSGFLSLSNNAQFLVRSQFTTSSSATGAIRLYNTSAAFTATSGTITGVGIGDVTLGFRPTSGTAAFNSVLVQDGINQTGGANGQITGVNNNPTITAAVDVTGFDHNPINPGNITGKNYGTWIRPAASLSGFGVTPAALVTVGAGTTTIPPLKFTSGTSLTSPIAGVEEFTTDDLFFTITTGTARKRLLMADPVGGLTSTRVLIATTNGRATDDAGLTYSGGILALTSSPTGPTPSALDNSSKLIPSAYVDGATGKLDKLAAFNRQTASYTLVLADAGKVVEQNVAGANNVTVPLNSSVAYPIGTQITVTNYGAGQVTIVPSGAVVLRSAGGKLKLTQQYSSCTLIKVGTDEWYVIGDLTL